MLQRRLVSPWISHSWWHDDDDDSTATHRRRYDYASAAGQQRWKLHDIGPVRKPWRRDVFQRRLVSPRNDDSWWNDDYKRERWGWRNDDTSPALEYE